MGGSISHGCAGRWPGCRYRGPPMAGWCWLPMGVTGAGGNGSLPADLRRSRQRHPARRELGPHAPHEGGQARLSRRTRRLRPARPVPHRLLPSDRIAPVGQQAHRRLTDLTGGVPCSRSPPYAPPAAPPDLVQAARDDMLFCAYVSGPRVRPVIVTLMVIQFEWHIPFSLLSARPPTCR
jgi:hypothetical protein